MQPTIIHTSDSGVTLRIGDKLDCERELFLSLTRRQEEHYVYLPEEDVIELRDKLTAILDAPVRYSYEIYQYKGGIRWSISQGSVDNFGLKVLSDTLPPGFYITYDKL
jgi:hypothetical protein